MSKFIEQVNLIEQEEGEEMDQPGEGSTVGEGHDTSSNVSTHEAVVVDDDNNNDDDVVCFAPNGYEHKTNECERDVTSTQTFGNLGLVLKLK
jgi:hypothetical protein